MQADQLGPAADGETAALATLRVTCQRQACAIETMTRVIANLRQGALALKAENAELRAPGADTRRDQVGVRPAHGSGEWIEARAPLDVRAPGAARIVVAAVLAERVAASVLERARLVISELVTNSVRHSGAPAEAGVVVRVRRVDGGFWLEVEDPGCDGVVAQHAANQEAGGGFGLHIVQALSERWGIERAAQGGTRVWAQLSDKAPPTGPDYGERGETTLAGTVAAGAPGAEAMQPRRHDRAAGPERAVEVHVIPQPRAATWGVYTDTATAALSEHTSATDAESAARARANGTGAIVVHDRYHRIHAHAK